MGRGAFFVGSHLGKEGGEMQTAQRNDVLVAERDNGWVSIMEAIRSSGRSRQVILAAALAGKLTARIIAGRVCIERASLERYEAEHSVK